MMGDDSAELPAELAELVAEREAAAAAKAAQQAQAAADLRRTRKAELLAGLLQSSVGPTDRSECTFAPEAELVDGADRFHVGQTAAGQRAWSGRIFLGTTTTAPITTPRLTWPDGGH
ncbi:MAG TPA: hypothetical protein VNH11_27535 [Pirellulales bacterium]|nr:hypothetical protein [Pirellulales bacterium]